MRFKCFVVRHALTVALAVFTMARTPFSTTLLPAAMAPNTALAVTFVVDALVPPLGIWLLERRARRIFWKQAFL